MRPFRCVPIATDIAERFRHTGLDDAGNILRHVLSTGRSPCRHCLNPVSEGDTALLGSYTLPRPQGIYWTPSPIFLHAGHCPRYSAADEIPPIVRTSLISVRAYDADDQCLYDLGHVCEGGDAVAPLMRAFDDLRTSFINIHTAKPGCLLCRVDRG